jgi:hypothetical protein
MFHNIVEHITGKHRSGIYIFHPKALIITPVLRGLVDGYKFKALFFIPLSPLLFGHEFSPQHCLEVLSVLNVPLRRERRNRTEVLRNYFLA